MPSDDTPLVIKISDKLPAIERRVIMVYVMREQVRETGPGSQVETIHGAPEFRDYHCQNMS